MVSQRRIKAFGLIVFLVVLTTLYITSSSRQTRDSEFYQKTTLALREKEAAAAKAAEDAISEADVGKRLKEAEEAAKRSADKKGGQKLQEVVGYGKEGMTDSDRSVAGRVVLKDDGVARVGPNAEKSTASPKPKLETEEDHQVEEEFNSILKKSPIIIFSKSYCPFSKKAKRILLEQYKIVPAPYVVELDEHILGSKLQDVLSRGTGRKTVPNILINGKSIGGGDDVEALHNDGKLINTVKSMGGKRIMEAKLIQPAKR